MSSDVGTKVGAGQMLASQQGSGPEWQAERFRLAALGWWRGWSGGMRCAPVSGPGSEGSR